MLATNVLGTSLCKAFRCFKSKPSRGPLKVRADQACFRTEATNSPVVSLRFPKVFRRYSRQFGCIVHAPFHSQIARKLFRSGECTSIYEAAARVLKVFREEPWSSDSVQATGYLEVSVRAPEVRYKILTGRSEILARTTRWISPRDLAAPRIAKPLSLVLSH